MMWSNSYNTSLIVFGGRQSSDSPRCFRIHHLYPRHRPVSPLPKRPQSPTFQLSILSTILLIPGLSSFAVFVLLSRLSSPLRRSLGAQALFALPSLPLHRQYYGLFQISLDKVQLQPPFAVSATGFPRTLPQPDLSSEPSPGVA